jgi:hypothetical protein
MSGSGWILHDGEGMPVPGHTRVAVRLRDNPRVGIADRLVFPAEEFEQTSESGNWWIHRDEWNDIMAYKVVTT